VNDTPRLQVPRLTQDELRELVLDIVSGQVLSSSQVPARDWPLVFMPLAMGALDPSDDLVVEVVGPKPIIPEEPVPPTPDDPMWAYADEEMAEARAERKAAIKDHDEWDKRYRALFADWSADVGAITGNMKDTFPRGVNGYPMFHAVRVIHKDDWERVVKAVEREWERSKDIEV